MKNYRIFLVFCLLPFLLSSCTSCSLEEDGTDVQADIYCSIPSNSNWFNCMPKIIDGVFYQASRNDLPNTFLAYDLNAKSQKWKVLPFAGLDSLGNNNFESNIYITGSSIWAPFYSGKNYLMEIDLVTGARKKVVSVLNGTENDSIGNFAIAGYGSTVYYFNNAGLASVDTTALTLVDADKGFYSIPVHQVKTFPSSPTTGHLLVAKDHYLVGSYRHQVNYADCGLFCWDMETGAQRWESRADVAYARFDILGDAVYSTMMVPLTPGDEAGGWKFAERGYDLATGSLKGEFLTEDVTPWCPPMREENNIIQVTNRDQSIDYRGKPLMFCLDADTLALKWRVNYATGEEWCGSNCQVLNGIVYRPASDGLFLYDLADGTLLGKDLTLATSDAGDSLKSYRWNDVLLVYSMQKGCWIGIKMNFKKNWLGKLEKG